jgi:hypothetical protein
MGYYTRYTLEIKDNKSNIEDDYYIYKLRKENTCAGAALNENGDSENAIKWYEWSEDMELFSKSYPDVTFILCGEGEEQGDVWKAIIKNGQIQKLKAKITFEEVE